MPYEARFHSRLAEIEPAAWDALNSGLHPLLSHTFLHGLEQHGCLQPRYGWQPYHLGLYDQARLIAAAPVYLKTNSHGEFVFDQAWAQAYQRYGYHYYPKLLCAVPYSPVNGPRLLRGEQAQLDSALLEALSEEAVRNDFSSCHINFPDSPLEHPDWLLRRDWQFHWRNDSWSSFDDFLAALTAKKRKNILQERAQVRLSGVQIRRVFGSQIAATDIEAMYDFYLDTFDRKGNLPALTPAFFRHLREQLSDRLMLALAERGDRIVAGALFLFDTQRLYGRYWGASEMLPGLHFELCYYQGIEFCLEHGLQLFEPGAQGEHKLARGFLPTPTCSYHWIADPRFRAAIADALREETQWRQDYYDELMQHSPFRARASA